jgi:hypothetical protein
MERLRQQRRKLTGLAVQLGGYVREMGLVHDGVLMRV